MLKPSPSHQPRLPMGDHCDNRGLFAPHFLKSRLKDLPQWADTAGMDEVFAEVLKLYRTRALKFGDATNEAQTEEDFIKPVLDLLWCDETPGDCRQVQVTIPAVGQAHRQPDYALFRSAEDRERAEDDKGTADYWRDVPCLADAKKWSASLDRMRGEENPSAQIANYLYRARVRWGILTNGGIWRLYERERAASGGVWFEVDLAHILDHEDRDAFRWFYLFFRRAAHLPDQAGKTFLEAVIEGSADYATQVGDKLKESVYDALRLLITGFVEHQANGLDGSDLATLKVVHENALIVLYRLLFLLYAEDRGLLPKDQPPYDEYSLYKRQRQINSDLRAGKSYMPRATKLWQEVSSLFELIDSGYPEGGIPEYNGGLFSPSKHPAIAHTPQDGHVRWSIGDHRLADVIDLLAYARTRWDQPGSQDIDYATLEVQHLGSIYEGLLELQPRYAIEDMVEVAAKSSSTFKPVVEVPEPKTIKGVPPRRIHPGEVYLVTDRGERKSSGSYYTPKFVVDYIVEQTIAPLTDEAAAKVAALRPEVDREIEQINAGAAHLAQSAFATERANAEAKPAEQIAAAQQRLLEPYLSISVLDPAMGSGHFLVGAADFISLAMATDPNLPTDLAVMGDEDAQAFYKRLVVERCLFGVDLNRLAVELAKLSLWLHTVSGDRALSFLDHHLRCGNSLIGARLSGDLNTAPPRADRRGQVKRDPSGQMVLGLYETLEARHLKYLLDSFREIMEARAGDATAERDKARIYREMDQVRERYRQAASLWLAPYFGAAVSDEQFTSAVEALGDEDAFAQVAAEPWFVAAQERWADRRFFSWQLEFPELFLEPKGVLPPPRSGFDAVIGNPPYVRQEQISDQKTYLADRYASIYDGTADLFVFFFARGLELLKPGRRLSYISSNSWLQTAYAEPLRRWVRERCTVEALLDLGNNRTFAEAPDVCPSVFVIANHPPPDGHRMNAVAFGHGEPPRLDPRSLAAKVVGITQHDQPDAGWQLTDDTTRALVAKLMGTGRPLGEVVGGRMYRGVLTGLNEAFIIDQATRDAVVAADAASGEILRPMVRGEDLRPWYQEDEGRWLIRVPTGWTRGDDHRLLDESTAWSRFKERYPAVAGHLAPFAEAARKRQDKGEFWWELRSCAYYDAFEGPKVFWPDICKVPRFSYDETGKYVNDKGSVLVVHDLALLGALQSRCTWLAISFIALHNKLRAGLWEYQLKSQFVARLPVPHTDDDRSALIDAATQATSSACARYSLHQRTRHRLLDLSDGVKPPNNALTAWWELDFGKLRAEVKKVWKRPIAINERDEWEAWFAAQRAEHQRLTARIVDLETELNDRVYRLYDLNAEEIRIVEATTKYAYGEV